MLRFLRVFGVVFLVLSLVLFALVGLWVFGFGFFLCFLGFGFWVVRFWVFGFLGSWFFILFILARALRWRGMIRGVFHAGLYSPPFI